MIQADRLTKWFENLAAVDGVSFYVPAGQILILLGPNGAGKTTTIRMLTSILRPTSGSALINGFDVVKDATKVRKLVGVLTEHHGLYGRMSAVEYLDFYGQLYSLDKLTRQHRTNQLLDQFGLSQVKYKRLGEYSKGMRQKLALVRALLHEPPVLLLDEPTSAMDPESARVVRDAINSLRSADRTVILCTHNLVEAEALADQIAIIRLGKIILTGSPAELKKELLGPTEFTIKLAINLVDGSLQLPDGVRLTGQGSDWLRFTAEKPEFTNPQLLHQLLVDRHLPVISVQEVTRSLEQVYIKAVHKAAQEESYVG